MVVGNGNVLTARSGHDLLPHGRGPRGKAGQMTISDENRARFEGLGTARREPFYVWIGYLAWSVFICSILSVFAIEYDLLPHTPEPSITDGRPLIDYFYYEIITFTTVGYGDIIPSTAQGKLLAMCTALLGATHGVTFVAIILQALTQHPPAKNQG